MFLSIDGEKKTLEGPVMAYLVMIDEATKQFPPIKFYQAKGLVSAYSGYEDLAIVRLPSRLAFIKTPMKVVHSLSSTPQAMKVPFHNLEQTLVDYNDCFDRKGVNCREPFGKKDFAFPTRENDMYHVMMITPAIHYTMGGLEIDDEAHVLRVVPSNTTAEEDENPEEATLKEAIPGLFAAGEVTGGVHGGNRLGGNSLLECVVFGRIAGQKAATIEATDASSETTSDDQAMRDEL